MTAGAFTHVDIPGITFTVEVSHPKGAGSGIASVPTTSAIMTLSLSSITSVCATKFKSTVAPAGSRAAGTVASGHSPNST